MEATQDFSPVLRAQRESFWKTFAALKQEIHTQQPRVLSVGCGFGYEAEPILRTFPDGTYTGIDIDEDVIHGAKRTNKGVDKAVFEVADATERKGFGENPWDVVILKHPQALGSITYLNSSTYGKMDTEWGKILDNSIDATKTGGIIVATASSEQELELIGEHLSRFRNNVRVIKYEKNPNEAEQGAFRDEFIIVARKLQSL